MSPVQISDIHLSLVNDFEVREDLESFCTRTVSTISPALVLVTGIYIDTQKSGGARCTHAYVKICSCLSCRPPETY